MNTNFPEWNAVLKSSLNKDELVGTRIEDGRERDLSSVLFRQGLGVKDAVVAIRAWKLENTDPVDENV